VSHRTDSFSYRFASRTLFGMAQRLVIPSREEVDGELLVARPWWQFSVRSNVAISRDRILDAWRGLSVLLVIFDHVIENQVGWGRLAGRAPLPTGNVDRHLLLFAQYIGGFGVQFFFVISGYIITTLLMREHQRNGAVSLPAFYVRRAFRILPPLWLILGVTTAMAALGYIVVRPTSVLLGASFLCNVRIEHCGWFAGHLWSLGVEEQFYLVWPVTLVVLRFRAVPQAALVVTILLLVLVQLFRNSNEVPDNLLSFACIALGCLYATSERFRSVIARAAVVPLILFAVAMLIGMALMPIVIRGQYRLQLLMHPLLICFVLFSCFRYRAFLEKRLIMRGLAGIGPLSYGIYLWQQLFLARSDFYLGPSLLEYAPAVVVLAALSYILFERPLMRVGAKLSRELIERRNQIARGRGSTTHLDEHVEALGQRRTGS
jgi:peptidoglycan/LPS O-acetylase OafA/YrhL